MKTLIDNTSLQLISKLNATGSNPSIIPLTEVINIFHFAEHVMFADEMEVISFSNPTIRENTYSSVDFLHSIDCIAHDHNGALLTVIDYSFDEYARACENAASHIFDDLLGLDIDVLIKCGELSNESTRPLGVDYTGFEKWITKVWSAEERLSLKMKALEERGDGICDYAICFSDPLYHQLKSLTSNLQISNESFGKMLYGLNVFFRTAINQSLASQRNAHHSPAPQRSKALSVSDQLMRHAIAQEIVQVVSSINGGIPSNFLALLTANESIPLPIFALHFLRDEKWRGPIGMLAAARKLRDKEEVRALRRLLHKLEKDYNSLDCEKKYNARTVWLNEFSNDLNIDLKLSNTSLFSIFRCSVDWSSKGVSFNPDLPGKFEYLSGLLKKYMRRSMFFSTLAKKLSIEESFGRDILERLNISILK